MSRRRRMALYLAGGAAALLAVLLAWGYFTLQSQWFFDLVRARLIATVEKATGGRVEIAAFRFDRAHFTAEVRNLVLHGTEGSDKPPLFRAENVRVGLKLVSLFKPSVDVLSLDVAGPRVYLSIGPGGRTNIPAPKVRQTGARSTAETILDLAVGRFRLWSGTFEIEGRGSTPINFEGRNLAIQLAYAANVPRYQGTLHADPVMVSYDDYAPRAFTVNLGIAMERNRIAVEAGRIASGGVTLDVRGALEDLVNPHASFAYVARAPLAEAGRMFRVSELRAGQGMVDGTGTWNPADGIALRGAVHAAGAAYRDNTVDLSGYRAEGTLAITRGTVDVNALRLSGYYVRGTRREPVEGRIAQVEIRGRDLDFRGIAITALGGTFTGEAQVRDAARYSAAGEVAGIQAARTVAMYSPEKLPWDALVYGKVRARGAFRDAAALQAEGDLTLSPAATGEPVNGHVAAAWEARTRTLDLGSGAVTLPHSRVEFSGAIGRQLRVRAETRDLNDVLPALGVNAAEFPVKLEQGAAAFDGTVTGALASPRVSGHLRATRVAYQGNLVDSFEGDVLAAPDVARLQNGVAARGKLRAQAQGSVVLSEWKVTDASPVAGSVTLRNGPLAELLGLAGAKSVDATGSLTATAFLNGTAGAPRVESDVEIVKGGFQGEPFDRITGHASYSGHRIEVRDARIAAGAKRVTLSGAFDHAPGHFDRGRVRFDLATNAMTLESIRALHEQREDLAGTVQAAVRGEVELDPAARTSWRLLAVNGDIAVKGLVLTEKPVGDAHLVARSEGNVLRASLDATAAGAAVKGSGEWRLEGDYPGRATVTFNKLDLANLRAWLTLQEASRMEGSADGELQIEGPALEAKSLRAELRIPRFEAGAATGAETGANPLRIANRGPIVAHYAKSVVTVDSFHLVGPGTDLTAGGRIAVEQKQPLDLRVEGHADLRFVEDFLPDVVTEGSVTTNATIRGTYASPQVQGRMEFQNAAFNIEGVPNGISGASGVVAFNNDRATIQSLSGDTGGGKIDLSGFVQYGRGPLVFRLHARARQVRVRYPEGVSTLANASLNLTGTEDASTLSGSITILRTGVNLQSDLSSLLAKSAEPVRTPSARPGLLGGMGFDVQVETAPETEFESSLTEGVQAEASLRLRGTMTNPAVLGRIAITQGKLAFFGTQYSVNQGTINFYNPIKVEPILNVDLETKARGIDITLSVTGPLNKLTLTPRSDPPLQFSEIVALLAQGRTPTSDPSLLRQQTEAPQSFQQAGASALLGSAIANPVAGRLQRFFGVSKLRIDPSISGVEYNPQARLTLEQQITPNLTFTYITDVTTSNPQVVQVEWSISKQWSAVALREENGLLGLDFFYKRRFK